jgi:hypothetical protein
VFSKSRLRLPALGILIFAGALWELTRVPAAFAPFVPQPLPQRALGDFDGDGRPDVALIQEGIGGSHVSVRLSGSAGAADLGTTVVSLITADIDHDGDLDLVAAAPSGQVVTWLNDGRGRFTRQEASRARGLAPEAAIAATLQERPAALGMTASSVPPPSRSATAVDVARVRAPTAPRTFDLGFLSVAFLRAPPLSSRLS